MLGRARPAHDLDERAVERRPARGAGTTDECAPPVLISGASIAGPALAHRLDAAFLTTS